MGLTRSCRAGESVRLIDRTSGAHTMIEFTRVRGHQTQVRITAPQSVRIFHDDVSKEMPSAAGKKGGNDAG